MNGNSNNLVWGTGFALVIIIVTALAIHLTPLKHFALVEPTIRDISPSEFHEKFSQNPDDYIFIDVRGEDAYYEKHAEGSINVPLHVLYDERKFLPKTGKEIVLICSGGRASGVGYSYLEHFGFLNLYRIEGGIERWEQQGNPLVRGR